MPDSGQLRQLHMREVGWTDTEAFEQGVIQRLEPELMAEKLIFPPQQTVVMALPRAYPLVRKASPLLATR